MIVRCWNCSPVTKSKSSNLFLRRRPKLRVEVSKNLDFPRRLNTKREKLRVRKLPRVNEKRSLAVVSSWRVNEQRGSRQRASYPRRFAAAAAAAAATASAPIARSLARRQLKINPPRFSSSLSSFFFSFLFPNLVSLHHAYMYAQSSLPFPAKHPAEEQENLTSSASGRFAENSVRRRPLGYIFDATRPKSARVRFASWIFMGYLYRVAVKSEIRSNFTVIDAFAPIRLAAVDRQRT